MSRRIKPHLITLDLDTLKKKVLRDMMRYVLQQTIIVQQLFILHLDNLQLRSNASREGPTVPPDAEGFCQGTGVVRNSNFSHRSHSDRRQATGGVVADPRATRKPRERGAWASLPAYVEHLEASRSLGRDHDSSQAPPISSLYRHRTPASSARGSVVHVFEVGKPVILASLDDDLVPGVGLGGGRGGHEDHRVPTATVVTTARIAVGFTLGINRSGPEHIALIRRELHAVLLHEVVDREAELRLEGVRVVHGGSHVGSHSRHGGGGRRRRVGRTTNTRWRLQANRTAQKLCHTAKGREDRIRRQQFCEGCGDLVQGAESWQGRASEGPAAKVATSQKPSRSSEAASDGGHRSRIRLKLATVLHHPPTRQRRRLKDSTPLLNQDSIPMSHDESSFSGPRSYELFLHPKTHSQNVATKLRALKIFVLSELSAAYPNPGTAYYFEPLHVIRNRNGACLLSSSKMSLKSSVTLIVLLIGLYCGESVKGASVRDAMELPYMPYQKRRHALLKEMNAQVNMKPAMVQHVFVKKAMLKKKTKIAPILDEQCSLDGGTQCYPFDKTFCDMSLEEPKCQCTAGLIQKGEECVNKHPRFHANTPDSMQTRPIPYKHSRFNANSPYLMQTPPMQTPPIRCRHSRFNANTPDSMQTPPMQTPPIRCKHPQFDANTCDSMRRSMT
ncbi:unnamed protein product [Cyprideis torosa]|uniref:Uncharacterized protein n=1 Tax=Cyprideis torosa TaxID=163714 RepID=A0A7R8W663_9CRUS|nr:unnamed protein product [Cyprideis torosa]CAG0884901.1 unnamed protein product [Cyprideis torosa]